MLALRLKARPHRAVGRNKDLALAARRFPGSWPTLQPENLANAGNGGGCLSGNFKLPLSGYPPSPTTLSLVLNPR
jgi:hypothetical protein